MSFLDRLSPVSLLIRLKRNVLPIGGLLGWAFVVVCEPLEGWMGLLLIVYGMWLADLHRSFNPDPPQPDDAQPWLPWNRLGAGEKLEYLLPTVLWIVLGLLVTTGMLIAGGTGIRHWLQLVGGLGVIAMGSWDLRRRWLNRFGVVESD